MTFLQHPIWILRDAWVFGTFSTASKAAIHTPRSMQRRNSGTCGGEIIHICLWLNCPIDRDPRTESKHVCFQKYCAGSVAKDRHTPVSSISIIRTHSWSKSPSKMKRLGGITTSLLLDRSLRAKIHINPTDTHKKQDPTQIINESHIVWRMHTDLELEHLRPETHADSWKIIIAVCRNQISKN